MKEQCQKINKRQGKYNLQDIFSIAVMDQRDLGICLNLLCGMDVSDLVKKPCNFIKVKSRFTKNNPLCASPKFIVQSTDCESFPSNVKLSLEIYCDKLDVFQSILQDIGKEKQCFNCKSVII